MATVFRARDTNLRRDVAVKVLFPHLARKPEVVSRFHREARAAAALDHPNILRVLDVGGGPASDGPLCDPPFMVLELIEGNSLRELATSEEPMLAESVAAIGVLVCRALGVAHRAGIVHRDIKPANIMASLTDGGAPRIVLADFGVAQVNEEDSVVTRTGALLGTPAYMSPEQASGEKLDQRSDLYSVGATLYRLVTGVMPFSGSTARVVTAIVAGDFVPPLRRRPQTGPDLARVVSKLMSTLPSDRFADAAEAEAALLAVVESSGLDLEVAIGAALTSDARDLSHKVLVATLDRAERAAHEGRVPAAIALADRALAIEQTNARALALIDTISSHSRPWGKIAGALAMVAILVAVSVVVVVLMRRDKSAVALPAIDASVAASERDAATAVATAAINDAAPPVRAATSTAASESADRRPPPTRIARRGDALQKGSPSSQSRTRQEREGGDSRPENTAGNNELAVAGRRDAGGESSPAVDGSSFSDAAAAAAAIDQPLATPVAGTLVVTTPSWCDLTVDGVASGRVNRRLRVSLPAGRHKLVCRQGRAGPPMSRSVDVKSGARVTVAFSEKVRVVVNVGDGVIVGGKMIKTGSSFTTSPKRLKVIVASGEERATVYVSIRESCTLTGRPLRCVGGK